MALVPMGRTLAVQRGGTNLRVDEVAGAVGHATFLLVDSPGVGWFEYRITPIAGSGISVTQATIVATVLKR